jgi:cob(I)alamin adenosyltransferase
MKAVSFEKRSISLDAAQEIIEAGIRHASELGLPVAVAVVDEGSNLKAFGRADGAGLIAAEVAQNKAYTAAAAGVPTGVLREFVAAQAGAEVSMTQVGRFMPIAGGLPIQVDGATVGAVGVSGGSAEQDEQIAQAALKALSGQSDESAA